MKSNIKTILLLTLPVVALFGMLAYNYKINTNTRIDAVKESRTIVNGDEGTETSVSADNAPVESTSSDIIDKHEKPEVMNGPGYVVMGSMGEDGKVEYFKLYDATEDEVIRTEGGVSVIDEGNTFFNNINLLEAYCPLEHSIAYRTILILEYEYEFSKLQFVDITNPPVLVIYDENNKYNVEYDQNWNIIAVKKEKR